MKKEAKRNRKEFVALVVLRIWDTYQAEESGAHTAEHPDAPVASV